MASGNHRRIRLSFLEREFFAESADGLSVRGHESIKVGFPDGDKHCRGIYPERLKQAQSIDTKLFTADFPMTFSTDLVPILENDKNGIKWLESFRRYCEATHGEQVPLTFSVSPVQSPEKLNYSLLPEDYFERTRGDKNYAPPKGILTKVPAGATYLKVCPPFKFADGKWIQRGIKYDREAWGSNGSEWSYSLKDPRDKSHFHAEGILLGNLEENDLENQQGDFENNFPFSHRVRAVYMVGISRIGDLNPLSINVELVE
jgi:hypothetical protein